MSSQFFSWPTWYILLYLWNFQRIAWRAWRGVLVSGIRNTCSSHISLRSVISSSSNFFNSVRCRISSFLALSFHVMLRSLLRNLQCPAWGFPSVRLIMATTLHRRASLTSRHYKVTLGNKPSCRRGGCPVNSFYTVSENKFTLFIFAITFPTVDHFK